MVSTQIPPQQHEVQNKDIPFIFFTENETGIITQQYDIVDNYRYCFIHVTNDTGSERVHEAAKTMMNGFAWTDLS